MLSSFFPLFNSPGSGRQWAAVRWNEEERCIEVVALDGVRIWIGIYQGMGPLGQRDGRYVYVQTGGRLFSGPHWDGIDGYPCQASAIPDDEEGLQLNWRGRRSGKGEVSGGIVNDPSDSLGAVVPDRRGLCEAARRQDDLIEGCGHRGGPGDVELAG